MGVYEGGDEPRLYGRRNRPSELKLVYKGGFLLEMELQRYGLIDNPNSYIGQRVRLEFSFRFRMNTLPLKTLQMPDEPTTRDIHDTRASPLAVSHVRSGG
jgi:hypothetical protein